MANKSNKNTTYSTKSKSNSNTKNSTMPKKNAVKSTNKGSKATTSTSKEEQVKKPLLSTKKKVGVAMYFTFLATLALVMGAQILLADVFSSPNTVQTQPNNTPQTESSQPMNNNQEQTTPPAYTTNQPSSTINEPSINNDLPNEDFDKSFSGVKDSKANQLDNSSTSQNRAFNMTDYKTDKANNEINSQVLTDNGTSSNYQTNQVTEQNSNCPNGDCTEKVCLDENNNIILCPSN